MEARDLGYAFTVQNDINFDTIHWVDDIFEHFPFFVEKNILQNMHFAADEPMFYEIDKGNILKLLDETDSYQEFIHRLRVTVIQSLLQENYTKFFDQPYGTGGNNVMLVT
jgi:hypothetical protein